MALPQSGTETELPKGTGQYLQLPMQPSNSTVMDDNNATSINTLPLTKSHMTVFGVCIARSSFDCTTFSSGSF